MSAAPTSTLWFARHEINLALRDWLSMMTAGNRSRQTTMFLILAIGVVVLHLIANAIVQPAGQ